MGRRIEAGPLVVALGAVLLLVSLFLDWYTPGFDAWTAFELVDLLLAVLALGALLAAIGLIAPEVGRLDRRWLAPLAIAALVLVASQILNPPPAAAESDPDSGAWVGLAGALLMAAGALLSFSRVKLAFTVEGRDPRQRVAAVDARHPSAPGDDAATEQIAPGGSAAYPAQHGPQGPQASSYARPAAPADPQGSVSVRPGPGPQASASARSPAGPQGPQTSASARSPAGPHGPQASASARSPATPGGAPPAASYGTPRAAPSPGGYRGAAGTPYDR